jgi:hypothetical protein
MFLYFFLSTPSDNTVSIYRPPERVCFEPRGDSVYYSIMAAKFDHPDQIRTPLGGIHSKRVLAPLIVHLLSRNQLGRQGAKLSDFEFDYAKKGFFTNPSLFSAYSPLKGISLFLTLGPIFSPHSFSSLVS